MPYHTTTITLTAAERRRLLAARHKRGLTQTELAKLAGCTAAAVSFVESGQREPSIGLLRALCGALRMTVTLTIRSGKDVRND